MLGQVEISGRAIVLDGDTINMEELGIRFYGVDAPEFAQNCTRPNGASWLCGAAASEALEDKLDNRRITCEQKDIDIYRRTVAVCRLDGEDLSAWLVASGWAMAYREFSQDYADAEATAREGRLNIWNGNFQAPEEFRREQSNNTETDAGNRRGCEIKGNISARGDRIYHLRGGEFYERTTISLARGERVFCTEAEAQEAGWRRSRR